MTHTKILIFVFFVIIRTILCAQTPHIVSTSPGQNELNVLPQTNISVTFDTDMNVGSFSMSTFVVNARSAGLISGGLSYNPSNRTITYTAIDNFRVGEVISVVLTTGIQSSGGISLDSSYVWTFTIKTTSGYGTFAIDSSYAVVGYPASIFCADVNNDNLLDIITANGSNNTISIFFNNFNGILVLDSSYDCGGRTYDVISADLNGDQYLDMAVATGFFNTGILIFLNNGNGTYANYTAYPLGTAQIPYDVEAADLDGDGDLDLAAAVYFTGDFVAILLNNGNGTFAQHVDYPVGNRPTKIMAAELDNDGDIDLTVINSADNSVSVLLNNGEGTFSPHTVYDVYAAPQDLYITDLDSDGNMDVAIANGIFQRISILFNNGNGTFAPFDSYDINAKTYSIYSGDIDADNDLDLITANELSYTNLYNNGSGDFSSFINFPIYGSATDIFSADMNNDGALDLVVSHGDSSQELISILINQAIAPQIANVMPDQNELHVSLNDNISVTFNIPMDESSINDFSFRVFSRYNGKYPGIISYNNQTRTATFNPTTDFKAGDVVTVVLTDSIQSAQHIPLDNAYIWSFTTEVTESDGFFVLDSSYSTGDTPYSPIAADLDNDGDIDIVTANSNSSSVSILMNNGDATFDSSNVSGVGPNPESLCAGDLDTDGDIDLVVGNRVSPGSFTVLLNNGDATFTVETPVQTNGNDPSGVIVADLNGDGNLDLAVSNAESDNISIFFNFGNATFSFDNTYATVTGSLVNAASVFAADLDNDGDIDLVAGNWTWSTNGYVSLFMNNGDGTFVAQIPYAVGIGCSYVRAADLDHDGYLDLCSVNHYQNTTSILLNNGDGTYGIQSTYTVGTAPYVAYPGDLDGDGDQDLVVQNREDDNVSILMNIGDGNFTDQQLFPAGDSPVYVLAADLDEDGDLDLSVCNGVINTITVLLNSDISFIESEEEQIPKQFILYQNYPNPFNPVTIIRYDLPKKIKVTLTIYDILGREVKKLVDEIEDPGKKSVRFNASTIAGGLYFYRLQSGDFTSTKKLILVK